MVPPADHRAGRYWVVLGVATFVLLLAATAAALVDVPYATLSPGSARSTEPLVSIQGTERFDGAGEILFLTVGISQCCSVRLAEAGAGWLDPEVDVLPSELVFGPDVDPDENREVNIAAMAGSKQTAAVIAATRLGIPLHPTGTGAIVDVVGPDTPAEGVLEHGDTIVAVDGTPVLTFDDLGPTVSDRPPGTTVTLRVEPLEGEPQDRPITLAPRPDDPTRGYLGITGDTRDFDPQLPFDVDIESEGVGGPSAGLAFTLAILDLLTEGDLTGGRSIAVTGTMQPDGTVGPVGGVVQKAAAAAAAGAEVLLVPTDEYADAVAHAHGLEVHAVADLDDALTLLTLLGGDPLPPAPAP